MKKTSTKIMIGIAIGLFLGHFIPEKSMGLPSAYWHVRSAKFLSAPDMSGFLTDGWEPFAVTQEGTSIHDARVFFRKEE